MKKPISVLCILTIVISTCSCSTITALSPNLSWSIESMLLSLRVNESEFTPSDFYIHIKRYCELVCYIVSALIILISVCCCIGLLKKLTKVDFFAIMHKSSEDSTP